MPHPPLVARRYTRTVGQHVEDWQPQAPAPRPPYQQPLVLGDPGPDRVDRDTSRVFVAILIGILAAFALYFAWLAWLWLSPIAREAWEHYPHQVLKLGAVLAVGVGLAMLAKGCQIVRARYGAAPPGYVSPAYREALRLGKRP